MTIATVLYKIEFCRDSESRYSFGIADPLGQGFYTPEWMQQWKPSVLEYMQFVFTEKRKRESGKTEYYIIWIHHDLLEG